MIRIASAPPSGARRRPVGAALIILLVLSGWSAQPPGAAAQAPPAEDEAAVLEVVQELFDAMAERDTARAARVLHPDGQFFRLPVPSDDVPPPSPHREFVRSLAGPGPALLERMENPQVLVHERIAVAWTPYDFHTDGEFSHCGVNAFHLVRDTEGWRIAGIVYTVEPDPEACPEGLGPAPGPEGPYPGR